MSDIELLTIQSGYNVSKINQNFTTLKNVVNDEVLHLTGGNNVLGQTVDMDSNRIINLPEPTVEHEAVPKSYVDNIALSGSVPLYALPSTYSIVDMNNLDYTMSDAEAISLVKVVLNNVEGKVLTYPTTSDGTVPQRQLLVFANGPKGMLVGGQTNGVQQTLFANETFVDLLYVAGISITQVNNNYIRSREISDTSYEASVYDRGVTLRFTSNSPITFNIGGFMSRGDWWTVEQVGTGAITFTGRTLLSKDGHNKTSGPGSVVTVYCPTATEASLSGDTAGTTGVVTSVAGVLTLNADSDGYLATTLFEDVTSVLVTCNRPNATILLEVTQDAVTPRTITFPAAIKWVDGVDGVVSTALGAKDMLALTTFDGGTTWYATLAKGFA